MATHTPHHLTAHPSIPHLLNERARNTPNRNAWFSKKQGHWQPISWGHYHQATLAYARAFHALGIKKGDRVMIMLPNSLEWELCEKGLLYLGAIIVGVDGHASAATKTHILQDSAATLLITAGILNLVGVDLTQCPDLTTILTLGAWEGFQPTQKLLGMGDFMTLSATPDALPDLPTAQDIATLIYTSGTTGAPKGIPYTHRQLLLAAESILRMLPSINAEDVSLCLLPLSHAFQRILNIIAIGVGGSMYFIADPRQFSTDMLDIRPTILVGVPKLYTRIQEAVEAKRASAPLGLGKLIPWSTIRRNVFGRRIRFLITGAAPMSTATLEFYRKLGVPLYEGYALSENAVTMAMNSPGVVRDGSVGKPMAENTLQLAEDGEILVRGEGVFPGYWNDRNTSAYFTPEGFYKTGDIGHFDAEGFLFLTGRKSDLIKTSGGRRITPRLIEEKLQTLPGVDIALVFGDGRDRLIAMLSCKTPLTEGYKTQLRTELARLNTSLAHYEQIHGLLVTTDHFTIENQHLTASLKPRKKYIASTHHAVIDELFQTLATTGKEDITILPFSLTKNS